MSVEFDEGAKDRFWSKVEVGLHNSCWEWQACRNTHGYGAFGFGDKVFGAHRVAWYFFNGPINNGLCVLHRCDNPACVNPAHLFLGTQADNMRDASRKNRMHPGEANGRSKLTREDVQVIRKLYPRDNISQRDIANAIGISRRQVGNIVSGRHWTHMKGGK